MTDSKITIRTIKQACKQYDDYKNHNAPFTIDLMTTLKNYAIQNMNDDSLNNCGNYLTRMIDLIQNKNMPLRITDDIRAIMNDADYVNKLTAYGTCLIAIDILQGIIDDYTVNDNNHDHHNACPYEHNDGILMSLKYSGELFYLCHHKSTIIRTAKLVLTGYPDEYIHESMKAMIEQTVFNAHNPSVITPESDSEHN